LALLPPLPPALLAEAEGGGPERFKALKFRSIGPAIGGRATRAAGVPGDPLTYYAAFAASGVWKSSDGGHKWEPIFDEEPVSSIGSIAVAPSDPNVLYVGTGEANIRGNVGRGDGIYKSTDAGKTWSQVWRQEGQIGTLVVHPRDPEVAYAAVLGHAFGPNPERGVYRTRDGGKSWERVLARDPDTGASDVALDPGNPRIVFAGLWQARRRPWEMTSGGPGGGLYRSADGGDTWVEASGEGLPAGLWGKVGVAVAPSDGRRVYALIEAEEGGLFRSDDGGESWKRANGHHALRQRAWYYSTLTVDPRDADVIWFPQVPMLRTIDGGKTIHSIGGFSHGDHHDLWIDPLDPRRMIAANDGGVDLSVDGGKSWWAPKLPTAQFYNVDADSREPYHVGGTMQDQGTASGPSNSLRSGGIALGDWRSAGGGEAGDFVYDLSEPGHVYAGEYGGIITHASEASGQSRNVSVYPTNPSGHGAEDLKVRFQWTAPIVVWPLDPGALYHGGNRLFRSTDRGESWQAVSPDLTRNDRSKQKWSGGPITGDNTGVEIYGTIFSIAPSPVEAGLLWVGTDDGLVHLTRDGGASWRAVTPPGVPEWATVEGIEASRHAAGTAYVVVDAHRLDDNRPYLWKTTDHGRTWTSLAGGLPQDGYLLALREDPVEPDLLFLGTERGVSFSRDGGATWEPLKLNLPAVAVVDLAVKGDDLVLATRGRSIWILDDLTPLRAWSSEIAARPLHLFATRPARRWQVTWGWTEEGLGENPPYGAVVHYQLKGEPEARARESQTAAGAGQASASDAEKSPEPEVVLEVRDGKGRLVRRLSSIAEQAEYPEDDPDEPTKPPQAALSAEPGLHRAVWDLQYEGAKRLARAKVDLGDPSEGPLAPPGRYTLRLTAGGETVEGTVEVLPDPRSPSSQASLEAQLEFALEVRAAIDRVVAAIEEVRSIRAQAADLAERLAGRDDARELAARARSTALRSEALEAELHNAKAEVVYDILARPGGTRLYSNLAFVYETAKWGEGAPTQGAREVFVELAAELSGLEARLADLKATDLAALDALSRALALPRIVLPKAP
jgi:photosystem II stability/assembly factor-like uncharacterized protein